MVARCPLLVVLALLAGCAHAPPAFNTSAKQVESVDPHRPRMQATGQGEDEKTAVMNGQRSAVYAVARDLAQTPEEQRAFEGWWPKFFAAQDAGRFLVEPARIKSRVINSAGLVEVVVLAEVDRKQVEELLVKEGVVASSRSLSQKVDLPRLMVVPGAKIKAARWEGLAKNGLRRYLEARRFEVVAGEGGPDLDVNALLNQLRDGAGGGAEADDALFDVFTADAYVQYDVLLDGADDSAKATGTVSIYETTTGKVVGTGNGTSRSYKGDGAQSTAITEALGDAMDQALPGLSQTWKEYVQDGKPSLLLVRGKSDDVAVRQGLLKMKEALRQGGRTLKVDETTARSERMRVLGKEDAATLRDLVESTLLGAGVSQARVLQKGKLLVVDLAPALMVPLLLGLLLAQVGEAAPSKEERLDAVEESRALTDLRVRLVNAGGTIAPNLEFGNEVAVAVSQVLARSGRFFQPEARATPLGQEPRLAADLEAEADAVLRTVLQPDAGERAREIERVFRLDKTHLATERVHQLVKAANYFFRAHVTEARCFVTSRNDLCTAELRAQFFRVRPATASTPTGAEPAGEFTLSESARSTDLEGGDVKAVAQLARAFASRMRGVDGLQLSAPASLAGGEVALDLTGADGVELDMAFGLWDQLADGSWSSAGFVRVRTLAGPDGPRRPAMAQVLLVNGARLRGGELAREERMTGLALRLSGGAASGLSPLSPGPSASLAITRSLAPALGISELHAELVLHGLQPAPGAGALFAELGLRKRQFLGRLGLGAGVRAAVDLTLQVGAGADLSAELLLTPRLAVGLWAGALAVTPVTTGSFALRVLPFLQLGLSYAL